MRIWCSLSQSTGFLFGSRRGRAIETDETRGAGLQRGQINWGKPMCNPQLSATVKLGARSIFSLRRETLASPRTSHRMQRSARYHLRKRGAQRRAWPGISAFCRRDEARSASSLNSALRPRESGFTKIGKSWVPVFVNEDHAKTAIFEQNRIRNYPNRAYPIPDGLEQSLLLGLQDDLEHCSVIVDKHSSTCVPRNTQAVRFDPNSLRTTSPFWRGRTEGSSEEVELVLPLND
jgi:hypothetical protein